jgi:uridine phosphorylase
VPIHLRPSAPIAPDALLPGDPGRALLLAQELLEKPLMSNHARGLWGYFGETADGRELTIQATGMGGPSAAIVFHELAGLGVGRAIRVGTCGALSGELRLGDLVVAESAVALDGTSRACGAGSTVQPDAGLTARLEGDRRGAVASADLFYDADLSAAGDAIAVEMEAATLFQLGKRLGVAVGCILIVSDAGGERIGDERLQEAALAAGRAASNALAEP